MGSGVILVSKVKLAIQVCYSLPLLSFSLSLFPSHSDSFCLSLAFPITLSCLYLSCAFSPSLSMLLYLSLSLFLSFYLSPLPLFVGTTERLVAVVDSKALSWMGVCEKFLYPCVHDRKDSSTFIFPHLSPDGPWCSPSASLNPATTVHVWDHAWTFSNPYFECISFFISLSPISLSLSLKGVSGCSPRGDGEQNDITGSWTNSILIKLLNFATGALLP